MIIDAVTIDSAYSQGVNHSFEAHIHLAASNDLGDI